MATIPSNTQFRGDTSGITIVEKGSSQTNNRAGIFTMQDFIDTIGTVPADNISGTGTANKVAKFTGAHTIADSLLNDDGTSVWNTGAGSIISNTAFGNNALIDNTTGTRNTANGQNSLTNNTIGSSNTSFGYQNLQFNTTGTSNTSFGDEALRSNTTGSNNVAVGREALKNNTSSNNVAIGYQAAFTNTTGANNVALGFTALISNNKQEIVM